MKKLFVVLISVVATTVYGQQIQVPNNVYFADIHVTIDAGAREKIQKNVDALLKYPTYFNQKVERAETYFPIIERVFREAGLPDDFKYLAIQESGLVSDAVSSSKAEGFWQFKKETALDFGLAVNPTIDERRHIVEASRGAAKYLVQSNAYYKNWINTMVSYYMGFTGAKAYARPSDANSKNMLVTDQTHIYFITFLAHKIAFENFIGKNPNPSVTLREMRANPGQSLGEIALATKTDPVELEKYNKWLLGSNIPHDKDYTILIPVAANNQPVLASNNQALTEPVVITKKLNLDNEQPTFTKVNGLKAIVAKAGDTKDKLALQARISTKKFLKLNDMYSFDPIVPGQVYYLEKKFTSGRSEYHVAQPGETLFMIAQQHGIRLKSLLSKNRMKKNEALVAGRLLWLQQTRPANIAVEYRRVETPTVPKTPQPLTAQAPTETQTSDSRKDETVLSSIKETASGAFQKAGAALNVPEKQPEVAKVGGDVFEETIVLNPEAAKEAPAKSEKTTITEENLAGLNEATEETSENATATGATQINAKTETSETINTEVAAEKIIETTPAEKTATAPEKPATLYPKTVAKTEQKVELREPVQPQTSETTATETVGKTPEKVAVQETEKPKVILKEPVTEPAPKTVTVADKKPVKVAEEPAKPSTHKVAKGETLYSISRKYNVTPSDLKFWNELGEKPLAIGQELKVTGEKQPSMPILTVTGPDKPVAEGTIVNITHRVGEGESMYQISRKYGVSIKEIMEWNNKADFNVSAGDELLIRSRPGSSRN